jgi:hypothetical protein
LIHPTITISKKKKKTKNKFAHNRSWRPLAYSAASGSEKKMDSILTIKFKIHCGNCIPTLLILRSLFGTIFSGNEPFPMSQRKEKRKKVKKKLLSSYQFEEQYAQIGDQGNCHQFQLRQHLSKASLLHQSIKKTRRK